MYTCMYMYIYIYIYTRSTLLAPELARPSQALAVTRNAKFKGGTKAHRPEMSPT